MPFLKIISAQSVFSLLDAFQPIWVVLASRTAARGHLICLLGLTIFSRIVILLFESAVGKDGIGVRATENAPFLPAIGSVLGDGLESKVVVSN